MHPLLALDRRSVVGHRGNAMHAPENTLESFRQAVALGVDSLEFDVHVTADGVPVVHHDPTLDRTTSGTGPIATLPLAAVRAVDAGARFTRDGGATFPYRDRGLGVPTLEEVLAEFTEMPVLLEIKTRLASAAVRATIERLAAESRTIVAAFDGAALTPFAGSRIAIGSSQGDIARLLAQVACGLSPRAVPYRAVCIPRAYRGLPLPLRRFARVLAPLGVPVHVWTVNEPAVATALWKAGVRGIISDDPGTMLRLRAGG